MTIHPQWLNLTQLFARSNYRGRGKGPWTLGFGEYFEGCVARLNTESAVVAPYSNVAHLHGVRGNCPAIFRARVGPKHQLTDERIAGGGEVWHPTQHGQACP